MSVLTATAAPVISTGSMPQETHKPSHPDTFKVVFTPGEFMSSLISLKDFKKGDVVTMITGYIPSERTRTSIQVGLRQHVEWNTDMVFAQHSCNPNLGVDLQYENKDEWRVVALRDIKVGDYLTWFYPSTEWDAWGGGFPCSCGTSRCIGHYKGGKGMTLEQLATYEYINPHIIDLHKLEDA
ncbi:hypothetical protein BDV98DRAFT_602886 [Pterulicium gracile]|uniref:SET domain-containing protein n=1 Tax=Pterulicium gracile TaxID=1884261 RepID=A0A5C3QRJ3_9AGAR|nr:hypothetical protein BDV98DRAFT_602886 [Pterula gracilis]